MSKIENINSLYKWAKENNHLELIEEWDYERNEKSPHDFKPHSGKKIFWKCKYGHNWQASINCRTTYNTNCPYCSGRFPIVGKNDFKTWCINNKKEYLLEEWDYERNEKNPIDFKPGSNKKVFWKCKLGHSWEADISHRVLGRNCPICNKEFHTSFAEQAIFYFIKQYFPDAINGDMNKIGMELDIYIPSINVAIEYDGIKWHTKNAYDLKKNLLCKGFNIRFIRIREKGLSAYPDCENIIRENDSNNDLEQTITFLLNLLGINADIHINDKLSNIYLEYINNAKKNSLSNAPQTLLDEWDYEKNKGLTPSMFNLHTHKKVWWKCTDNQHVWLASISHRVNGENCPYCSNRKLLKGFNDLETFCKQSDKDYILQEWNYSKNDLVPADYLPSSGKKVWWKCNKCGSEWQTTINKRISKGTNCPICSNSKVQVGINDFATWCRENNKTFLIEEWDYTKNIVKPTDITKGSETKIFWKCKKGHEWSTRAAERTVKSYGCPYCSNKKIISGFNDFETWCLNNNYEILLNEWDYEMNEIVPNLIGRGTKTKISWKCSKDHKYKAVISDRIKGTKCPYCANRKVLIGFNDFETWAKENNYRLIEEWDFTQNQDISLKQITYGSGKKVWWVCKTCGNRWRTSINNRTTGTNCPKCRGKQ